LSEKIEKSRGSDLSSKFWRTFFILITAVLIFAGPTYFVLVLWRGLDLDYILSMAFGFSMFIVGLVLLVSLIKKKSIT